uniref:Uncharacterized protein n=1 Tax=Zea mays TaxID=4577 RepID=C4J1V8_MAIZE|nr:unknown [Zea mays]
MKCSSDLMFLSSLASAAALLAIDTASCRFIQAQNGNRNQPRKSYVKKRTFGMQPTLLARFRLVLCAISAEAWTFPFPRPSGPAAVSSPAAGELLSRPFRGESSVEPPHIRFALGSSSSAFTSSGQGQAPPSHPLACEEQVARALTPWEMNQTMYHDGDEDDGIEIEAWGGVLKTFCAAVRVSESCARDSATESRPRTSIRESSRSRFPRSDSTPRMGAPAAAAGGRPRRSSRMVSTRVRRRSQNRRSSEAGLASATVAESMGSATWRGAGNG